MKEGNGYSSTPSKKGKKGGKLRGLFPSETFDCVLVDPPCSGLGLRPRWKSDVSLSSLESFANYQRHLLSVASRLVVPGGVIVYSTCTIDPLENEDNVAFALKSLGLRLLSPEPYHFGQLGVPADDLSDDSLKMIQRFDPQFGSELDSVGFFIAKFQKVA